LTEIGYESLEFTQTFLESFTSRDFTSADRAAFLKALRLLDTNERHRSLRVHKLAGELTDVWSASASDVLRISFVRVGDNRKRLLACSRHYDR
jgi:mRNA-degrading endonuclease YafQ of YafQ-DinJ toxin-antitoxin module